MEKDYTKLFQTLRPITVPTGLSRAINAQIEREQRHGAQVRIAVFAPLAFLSGVAVVLSFQYLAQELSRSGISEYFSILLSDSGVALTYWKEFSLSVVEQLPVLGGALFLSAVLMLLSSLKSIIQNTHIAQKFA